MNRKQIFTTAGLGALTVALVALPSSSARKPDPSSAAGKQSFQQQAQDVTNQMGQLQRSFDDLKLAQSVSVDGDDGGMQVFVASDGGWLGARISEVTPDKVKEFNLPAERGVILGKIVPDSPAAKAGLKHGDVVMEINGQRVEGTEQFRRMIREIPAGRATQFTVWRDGRTQNISGRAEYPSSGKTSRQPARPCRVRHLNCSSAAPTDSEQSAKLDAVLIL